MTGTVGAGRVWGAEAAKLATAKTVNGQSIAIEAKDAAVMINNARGITADIEATIGVIHVIDAVLLPK